jgi:hypothetical protein
MCEREREGETHICPSLNRSQIFVVFCPFFLAGYKFQWQTSFCSLVLDCFSRKAEKNSLEVETVERKSVENTVFRISLFQLNTCN